MKRLTTLFLGLLIVCSGFGQKILTYDGKVLTSGGVVLRAGDPNQPLNISTTCEVWLDGKDASTISLNVNKVIQWDDKSGFDRHVSNAVDATRPTYDSNTGRVTFTASNSTFLTDAAFVSELTQPNTIFLVYKKIGALDQNEVVFDGSVSSVRLGQTFESDFRMNAGSNLDDGTTNANDNIHIGLFNGASSEYWINGVSVVSGEAGANTLDGINLGEFSGGGIHSDCEIMEVIVYNADISDSDRDVLTTYLKIKWELNMWLIFLLIPNIRRRENEYKMAA